MSNSKHFDMLKQGVEIWNQWRKNNPDIKPDLSGVYLSDVALMGTNLNRVDLVIKNGVNLRGANLAETILYGATLQNVDLREANLEKADLSYAQINEGDFRGANGTKAKFSWSRLHGATFQKTILSESDFWGADLGEADLSQANLSHADLRWTELIDAKLDGAVLRLANLSGANLRKTSFLEADLTDASLVSCHMIETNFENAIIAGCWIYGISAWKLKLEGAVQTNLVITNRGEPIVTVDDLEVAQFIYLLLNNAAIRKVIDTIGKKAVLILGRFTANRLSVLNSIREEIRKHNYLPILFDFEKPASKNLTETISALAHMARFIIADLTDPRAIPQELQRIVPHLPSVPVQPLLEASSEAYGMFWDFMDYSTVLRIHTYKDLDDLRTSIREKVITPVEEKVKEIQERRKLVEEQMMELNKAKNKK